MDDPLRVAQKRIQQFERLGGVSLSTLDPEERHDLIGYVHTGLANFKKAVFWFECPLCGHRTDSDLQMEPMCTGPSWTDDHEPIVMVPLPLS